MRLFVLVFSLAACFPCNAQGQGDVGYESSSIGVNSLINAAAPHTSTLAVGIYSQPNIVAESSGLISASTTYALPAWTGASLRSSESAPDISTLTVGMLFAAEHRRIFRSDQCQHNLRSPGVDWSQPAVFGIGSRHFNAHHGTALAAEHRRIFRSDQCQHNLRSSGVDWSQPAVLGIGS